MASNHSQLDPERVRVALEREIAEYFLTQYPGLKARVQELAPTPAERIRRLLNVEALRLWPATHETLWEAARKVAERLGVTNEIEIYQRAALEPNAGVCHSVMAPVLLQLDGSLLPNCDAPMLEALLGHELGHYVAHGMSSVAGRVAIALRFAPLPRELRWQLNVLSMAAELTADRYALLACGDVEVVLRLLASVTSGLPASLLGASLEAYKQQWRERIEELLAGREQSQVSSHPEHSVRAWALMEFAESRTFQELTGSGSGTRDLEQLDRRIRDVLTHASMDTFYEVYSAPPAELYECGLAAAVLVANADDEMAAEEAAAIEQVFAPLVDGWQEYLDRDVAARRFDETAPVIARGGADLQERLFQVLVRVMLADGVVDPRELAAIGAVGDKLGVGAVFRRELQRVLRCLGLFLEVPPPPPLPVRGREAMDALDALACGVKRRGQSQITLRRLLRLLGVSEPEEQTLVSLREALAKREVSFEIAPDLARLDSPLTLLASRPPSVAPPSTASPVDTSREGVVRAISRLREQLVSGDGRSPSVLLRRPQLGRVFDLHTLEAITVGLPERVLATVRGGRAAKLVEALEVGKHPSAAACAAEILLLLREHLSRAEETGAHDLHLGYPVLMGVIGIDVTRTGKRGYPVRAPLVLTPVDIEIDGAGARGFKLRVRKDEQPLINRALLRVVFSKKGFAVDDAFFDQLDELAGDETQGVDAVLAKLEERGLPGLRLAGDLKPFVERNDELSRGDEFFAFEECALLGLFPQSGSDLLQDYDALLSDLQRPEANLSTLLGAADVLLPSGTVARQATEPNVSYDVAPVSAADPAQRRVIEVCLENRATVIDGPPGTGKSQVIVNLVADALRRGQRVAIVCEKRAALDVVSQRLDGLGLRHALAVVHDVQEDRKALFKQIAERLDAGAGRELPEREIEATMRAMRQCDERLDRDAAILASDPGGAGLKIGQLHALAAISAPDLGGTRGLAFLDVARIERVATLLSELRADAHLWRRGSLWRGPEGGPHRASLASAPSTAVRDLGHAARATAVAAAHYEAAILRAPARPEAIEPARGALEMARRLLTVCDEPGDEVLLAAAIHAAMRDPARLAVLEAARSEWQRSGEALVRVGQQSGVSVDPATEAALVTMRAWSGRFFRFFTLGWWAARGVVRREVGGLWPERATAPLDAETIHGLLERLQAGKVWRAIELAFDAMQMRMSLPDEPRHAGARLTRAAWLAGQARSLVQAAQVFAAAGVLLPDDQMGVRRFRETVDAASALLEAKDALASSATALRSVFPWLDPAPQLSAVQAIEQALQSDGERVVVLDRKRAELDAMMPDAGALCDSVAEQLVAIDDEDLRLALSRAWARAWLERIDHDVRHHAAMGTDAGDAEVAEAARVLVQLERRRSELEVERVLAQLDASSLLNASERIKYQRKNDIQRTREEMLKETRKQRRLWPLRRFVRTFADRGLLELMPVWLLSPETMAILFPREPLFDLVVFDEASQCTVESGFPVLMRARRVVIAGDEKQMPPTSFFSTTTSDADDELQIAETSAAEQPKDMLVAESLLSLARARVVHAGLTWHYRCQHESLIAFSNHAIYQGELLTIPSTATDAAPSAIRWVSVDDGAYVAGENPREAEKVVDVLHQVLSKEPAPTVGVISFNVKQRRCIDDAIDARREADPAFANVWAKAMQNERVDERPFVKNLENVQGDEREVIVFSLGHAPVERKAKSGLVTKTVPARFGPLGRRGGERRLNVAVSRAKRETFIVSSFVPQMLSVGNSRNAGPRLFKGFLEYAFHTSRGEALLAKRKLDEMRARRPLDEVQRQRAPVFGYESLAVQIAMALEMEGIRCVRDVGASGFRVPLAVVDPCDESRYVLAILCDDGQERLSSFERYVHRLTVLGGRGWKVLHVTPATWHKRGRAILETILDLVPGGRDASRQASMAKAASAAQFAGASAWTLAPAPNAHSAAPSSLRLQTSQHPAILQLQTRLPREQLRAIELMISHRGSMSVEAFSASMDLLAYQVNGFISTLQQSVNVSAETLSFDPNSRELRLDVAALEASFGQA